MSTPFRRGDFVTLIGHTTINAFVALASENGRSLMLLFDGMFWPTAAGGFVGSLPLLQHEDGSFREIVHGAVVTVQRRDTR